MATLAIPVTLSIPRVPFTDDVRATMGPIQPVCERVVVVMVTEYRGLVQHRLLVVDPLEHVHGPFHPSPTPSLCSVGSFKLTGSLMNAMHS